MPLTSPSLPPTPPLRQEKKAPDSALQTHAFVSVQKIWLLPGRLALCQPLLSAEQRCRPEHGSHHWGWFAFRGLAWGWQGGGGRLGPRPLKGTGKPVCPAVPAKSPRVLKDCKPPRKQPLDAEMPRAPIRPGGSVLSCRASQEARWPPSHPSEQ